MTPTLIEKAGVALHGIGVWKAPLAHDLNIPLRQLRRMIDGENPIPPGVWVDIRGLLLAHSLGCRDIAAEIIQETRRNASPKIANPTAL